MFLAMHVSWNPGSIIIEITLYRRRLLLLIMDDGSLKFYYFFLNGWIDMSIMFFW